MPSRQDQLHSYQFSMQRVVAALVMRETDPAQSPFRRAAGATLASILIAAIIAAGYGVYGVFTGRGNEGWRKQFSVVIEEETGARFVFQDDKLRPALNFASAVLAGGSGRPEVHNVAHASLTGIPRGVPFGVPGLPDSLPGADDLLGVPLSVCGVAGAGTARPSSVLAIGDQGLAGGGRALTAEEALVVKAVGRDNKDIETFLLWNRRLFPIAESSATALYESARVRVPAALVNMLPRGERIVPYPVAKTGAKSAQVQEYSNGQVLKRLNLQGVIDAFAVVTNEGIVKLTPLQTQLVLSSYAAQNATEQKINSQKFNGLKVAGDLVPKLDDPVAPPRQIHPLASLPSGNLCAVSTGEDAAIEVRGGMEISLTERDRTAASGDGKQVVADYVFVEPGKGALLTTGTATLLVTDRGIGYALARPDVSTMLGYDGKTPVKVPSALAALIPSGPALDPDKVRDSAPQS